MILLYTPSLSFNTIPTFGRSSQPILNVGFWSTGGKLLPDHADAASWLHGLVVVDLGITYGVVVLLLGVNVPANSSLAAPGLRLLANEPKALVQRKACLIYNSGSTSSL